MRWDPVDIAWVAGLFEGEGCVTGKNLVVVMCDEDSIQRLKDVTGVGTINGPVIPKNPNHKPSWRWQVSHKRDVARLALAIYPMLNKRRQAKMAILADLLAKTKTTQRINADHCIRGHAYTYANTYVGAHGRQCRQCLKFNEVRRLQRTDKFCEKPGCDSPYYARGMCRADYQRWWNAQKKAKPVEVPTP